MTDAGFMSERGVEAAIRDAIFLAAADGLRISSCKRRDSADRNCSRARICCAILRFRSLLQPTIHDTPMAANETTTSVASKNITARSCEHGTYAAALRRFASVPGLMIWLGIVPDRYGEGFSRHSCWYFPAAMYTYGNVLAGGAYGRKAAAVTGRVI